MTVAYRPDIDGLRAIAIASVVVFHAFPELLPGGFIGVDTFFVISGFLIGSIILDGLRQDKFSFVVFYARRVCRLFPALLVVLAATSLLGWLFFLPGEFRTLGKHVVGGTLYVSNFVLLREVGYFDVQAEFKPLLHLWSLAIEEQFYLFMPLLALLAWRRRIGLATVIMTVLAASFILNVVRVDAHRTSTFFLPWTRFWELMLGVLLAYATVFPGHQVGVAMRRLRTAVSPDMMAVAGAMLTVMPMPVISAGSNFPGWWATLPTVGTALLIAAGQDAWLNRKVFACRHVVYVGLISYPLYLWHWPLLSVARVVSAGDPPWGVLAAVVGLSCLLAALTYHWIEMPIRRGRMRRQSAAAWLIGASVLVGLGGAAAYRGTLPAKSGGGDIEKIDAAIGEWEYPGSDMEKTVVRDKVVWRSGKEGPATLFLGDSNVEQYWPRVRQLRETEPALHNSAVFVTDGGCPPIPGVTESARRRDCGGYVEAALSYVEQNDVDTVVVAAAWSLYFGSTAYWADGMALSEPQARELAIRSLQKMIGRLTASGRRVYLVLSIPHHPHLDPANLVKRSLWTFQVETGGVARGELKSVNDPGTEQLRRAALAAGAIVIDPLEMLCDANSHCAAFTDNGEPRYKDGGHLRPKYVRESVAYLDEAVRKRK